MSTQMQPEEKLTGRWLKPDEFDKVEAIFQQYDAPLPSPEASAIYVFENDAGEIVHLHSMMLMWHAEPMWTDERYRHLGLWKGSGQEIIKAFEGQDTALYSFADNERTEHCLEEFGMQKLPYSIYMKRFSK